MTTLWTFNFNSPCRFIGAEYIFEFEGRKYRLIRGTEEECDKLLTIADDSSRAGTDECIERTMRLLNYLSWQLGIGMQYLGGAGHGFQEGTLKVETVPVVGYRKRNLSGYMVGISSIPNVTNSVQIDALSLWNEAEISTSPFLAFINYWKIIELFPPGTKYKGKPKSRAINWINSVPENKIIDLAELKKEISGRNASVGEFLWGECRNSIVHITRKPTLKPGSSESYERIYRPKLVIRALAKYYIQTELGLGWYSHPLKILQTKKLTRALKDLKELKKQERIHRRAFKYLK